MKVHLHVEVYTCMLTFVKQKIIKRVQFCVNCGKTIMTVKKFVM